MGKRIEEVAALLAEGAVLYSASSFDREREVHNISVITPYLW